MTPLDLPAILARLERERVEYVVIGGIAATLQGSAYVTYDLDLCYRRTPKNLALLAAALGDLSPTLRGAPSNLPFRLDAPTLKAGLNFTLDTPLGPIDLLGEVQPMGLYDRVCEMTVAKEVHGHRCQVLSLDGLLITKKFVGRRKDLLMIPELEALKQMGSEKGEERREEPPATREPRSPPRRSKRKGTRRRRS